MIRHATLEDIKEVYKLGNILNSKFDKVYDLKKMFMQDYNKIYIATDHEKVVGMLMAIVLYDTCEIENIIVLEEYRNRKIATNLIDYLISEFSDSIKIITLEVAIDNQKAINLYKKFGLEIISTRKNYYDNKDAYLMGVTYDGH